MNRHKKRKPPGDGRRLLEPECDFLGEIVPEDSTAAARLQVLPPGLRPGTIIAVHWFGVPSTNVAPITPGGGNE